MTTRLWILGFIAGAATLFISLSLFTLGVAILVVVCFLRPRPAAGGACMAWGGAFLIVMWQAAERCAALSRQPNTSCTMGDNTPFAITGVAVLALGLVLSAYAARRARVVALPSTP